MNIALQVVLALAVAALTAALIPLLLQLRRTAAALETFAHDARRDLNRVAEDLHQTRVRVDGLADLAQAQLEHPGPVSQIAFGIARALPAILQGQKQGGNFLEALFSGVDMVLTWFRNRPASQPHPPSQEASHE